MLPAKLAYQISQLAVDAMRAVVRSSTQITESSSSFLLIPRQPLVTNPATDSVPSTQLRHREAIAECIVDELNPLFHR